MPDHVARVAADRGRTARVGGMVRRRLARTEVARFERIPRRDPYATGPVFVEYEFTIAGDDV